MALLLVLRLRRQIPTSLSYWFKIVCVPRLRPDVLFVCFRPSLSFPYNPFMQRTEEGFIIISCDFCGTDWDEVIPMIEGHHGSVLCLECMKVALSNLTTSEGRFDCSMCLREQPGTKNHWRPVRDPGVALLPGANPLAVVCESCINQASGTFSKDPDVDWKRPVKK